MARANRRARRLSSGGSGVTRTTAPWAPPKSTAPKCSPRAYTARRAVSRSLCTGGARPVAHVTPAPADALHNADGAQVKRIYSPACFQGRIDGDVIEAQDGRQFVPGIDDGLRRIDYPLTGVGAGRRAPAEHARPVAGHEAVRNDHVLEVLGQGRMRRAFTVQQQTIQRGGPPGTKMVAAPTLCHSPPGCTVLRSASLLGPAGASRPRRGLARGPRPG